MNIIDLGSIDRLVRRNSNLLTAFKVIDDVNSGVVIENIQDNIRQFDTREVMSHNNVLDIVTENGTIPISYYFAEKYSKDDVELILREVKWFCESLGVNFVN